MKTAIDYIQEENKKLQRGEKSKGWVEIIEQAQKDAYNQAIEDAAKNAKIFKMEGVMKTAEEWFDTMITGSPDIKEVISKIQKEAYNQALEDACNHDKVDVYYDENVGYCTLQQSILKLKK